MSAETLRRTVLRALVDSTPICACGYMNSAIAEPIARVANGIVLPWESSSEPAGWWVVGLTVLSRVLAALKMMRASELRRTPRTPPGKGQIRAGLRYVAHVPELWISFLMLLIIGTASYNFTVVLPLFVEKGLNGSDAEYTLVYAAFSVGGLLGTLVVARRTRVDLRSIIIGAAGFGIALLALSFVPNVLIAYPLAALVGGTSVAYATTTTAIAQLRSDRQMIGRVVALQTILQLGTTPIGGPILGWVADAAGGRSPVLVGGFGFAVLMAGFIGAYQVDKRLFAWYGMPAWLIELRFRLTSVIVPMLALTVIAANVRS